MRKLAEEMTVIEATLVGGVIADSPANGGLTGRKWRVRVFAYGLSKNRYPYPANGNGAAAQLPLKWTERSAQAALKHLEGARCFADHAADAAGKAGHSVRDLVGYYSNAALGAKGPEATLTLLESEKWAREKLLAAWQAGRSELIGFSLDAVIGVRPVGEGVGRALEVDDIVAIHSVDMVSAPSSGGRALQVLESGSKGSRRSTGGRGDEKSRLLVASLLGMTARNREQFLIRTSARERDTQENHNKGATMKEDIERILETLRAVTSRGTYPGDLAMRRLQEVLEAEATQVEADPARVLSALADWMASGADGNGELSQVREQVSTLQQQFTEASRRQRAAENRLLLDSKLRASRLPKPLTELVVGRFRPGGDFTEEDIEAEIQNVREAYAAVSPTGRVVETGRVRVLREPADKMQMAMDRLFDLPVEDKSVPAFHGIREAYIAYTGDEEVSGALPTNLRVREVLTSTTFPNALGATLRRLLLQDYREMDFGIGLIAQISSVPDFRTQERVRVGYFGDLPAVDPEAADYDEFTAPEDEKASYSVVTFGGIVTITRKMIINDDLGVVPRIVSRLGRSARRTLAQRVFNLMINNPTIYDSVAWFHATHGNLGSTALSATELNVVRAAMRNRTEKDSGKKLGIAPYVLVAPHELEGLARQTNERQYTDSNFTPNPVRFLFGRDSERIVISPLLSDANDWYVFANKEEAPTVEVGFLQGRQEPEFFLSDNPTSGTVFTSDKIRYKVRHEFEAVVIDYRGAYKEAVA
ncbi:MAG: Mu-like prophage major head subunit gpT family protein [Acidobacteria bacterium]|nr:Mu-like prophage major head subunit gpT family protein [Acidobacteriota bacterium]